MGKNKKTNFMKFYPVDFEIDTRVLTPFELGCYVRLLNHIWIDGEGGTITIDVPKLARVFTTTLQDTYKVLTEIYKLDLLDITELGKNEPISHFIENVYYLIISRRMQRDAIAYKTNASYMKSYRKKRNVDVRSMLGECKVYVRHRSKKQEAKNNKPSISPFWQRVVDHISKAYEQKKQAPIHLTGHDFKELKGIVRVYQPWGTMALYDLYLDLDDEWVIHKAHFSFGGFVHKLPALLDNALWKAKARIYENELYGQMPECVSQAVELITKPKVAL